MVPALTIGGVLLSRRNAWGYVITAVAGVQASLYLLVLSVNSTIFVFRGLSDRTRRNRHLEQHRGSYVRSDAAALRACGPRSGGVACSPAR